MGEEMLESWIELPLDTIEGSAARDAYWRPNRNGTLFVSGQLKDESAFGRYLEVREGGGLTMPLPTATVAAEPTLLVWMRSPYAGVPRVERRADELVITLDAGPSSGSAGDAGVGSWALFAMTFSRAGAPQLRTTGAGMPSRAAAAHDGLPGASLGLARLRIFDRRLTDAEIESVRQSDVADVAANERNAIAYEALVVPIHLDALVVTSTTAAMSLAPDLSRLPYIGTTDDGTADVNADVPNVARQVTPDPFDSPNAPLEVGVHLHWALPDALTRAQHGPGGTLFPRVPNRWLVTCTTGATLRTWLIESDYLHPEQSDVASDAVFVIRPPGVRGDRPYRRMGRCISLDAPAPRVPKPERFPRLTVVGDGSPTFAALYPHCRSVFGFCDSGVTAVPGARYDVFGWYDDVDDDPLRALHAELVTKNQSVPSAEDFLGEVKKRFKWSAGGGTAPQRVLCHSRLTFEAEQPVTRDPKVSVSVGNSSAEALSLHLARALGGQTQLVEDQLESILLAKRVSEDAIQIGPQLAAARHAKGFSAVSGGTLWTVRKADGADAEAAPPEMVGNLDELNRLQRALDRSGDEIAWMRRQLFADWSQYMLQAYRPEANRPSADAIKDVIERRLAAPLEEHTRTAHSLRAQRDAKRGALGTALERFPGPLVLQEVPAPRYYQPTEPVVLLAGPSIQPSDRHGRDGRNSSDGALACTVLAAPALFALRPMDAMTVQKIATLTRLAAPSAGEDPIGATTWQRQPWHPILLAWEIELAASDAPPSYALGANDDLSSQTPSGTARIRGTSILSQHARGQYRQSIVDYVEDRILGDYRKANGIPASTNIVLDEKLDDIEAWYKQTRAPATPDPILSAIGAYRLLLGLPLLSQALSGFNDGCLMLRQGAQLPIAEPIGFPLYRAFTNRVKALLGPSIGASPDADLPFRPIRDGVLRVLRLRLIDTFGQVLELQHDAPPHPLPPRIVPPARLELRWQSGTHTDVESNASAASSPICGWLLPNFLDKTVTVYDAAGFALGVLAGETRATWGPAPGEAAADLARLRNHHLARVVVELVRGDHVRFSKFLLFLNMAMQEIEPEGHAEQASPVFLLGRPLAIARVSARLALQGHAAVHQAWETLADDIRRDSREAPPPATTWPVRLGTLGRLDDGVVGHWRDDNTGFHTVLDGKPAAHLTINGEAQKLCLLLDPLGSVHAVTGAFPTGDITLPADECDPALKRIQLAHMAAPILTPDDSVAIAMPSEPGQTWSWLERRHGERVELALDPAGDGAMRGFSGPLRLREGWLQLHVEKAEPTREGKPQ